jgi:class 3 adenylate cyclase/tetratricopeptide (TPR) repeat protein
VLTCLVCGAENREGARFCDSCGSQLSPTSAERESRKTVTIVFCDVVGSTSLGERLDAESLRKVMTRYFETMRAEVERHGGTIGKFIGDAVIAGFGIPQVHEDDALRAVRAAAGMRAQLTHLNEELERGWGVSIETRTGINTGEVIVGESSPGGSLALGDAVNVGARLEQAAGPGEILIGPSTYQLVRRAVVVEPVEPLSLKGKTQAIQAYRLVEINPVAALSRSSDGAFVGRARELRLVFDAYDHAVADRASHLVTILGVAGVGKSRLVAEAIGGLPGDPRVLGGRCLPYGDGITFWPIAEIVRQAASVTEADTPEGARSKIEAICPRDDRATISGSICSLIGLGPPSASIEQGFWALRKLFESLAQAGPLIVTLDDLQWAEPTLLDLIDHLADWSRDAPIVLLCIARPEFLEVRPGWGGGKMNAVSMLLEPLSAAESDTLVGDLLPNAQLPPGLKSRILETAGGNPLFLEETMANLVEEGLLVRDGEVWRTGGDDPAVEVPATVHALLAARLDRLGRQELIVIEGASVVGQVFYRSAVSELAPEALRPDVGTYLLSLIRKDLVRPDTSSFAGEETFRFRHLLIRDAAYQAMPKQTRAELHERFARWLERTAGERVVEYEEIVGYHLEQAYRYRVELRLADDATRALAREAGHILGRAGVRATNRGDHRGGSSLLERADELVPDALESVDWLIRRARAEALKGDTDGATLVYREASARGHSSGDEGARWRGDLALMRQQLFIDPAWSPQAARELAERAIPVLEALNDDYGLAWAWRLMGDAANHTGRFEEWHRAYDRAAEHARRAGEQSIEAAALNEMSDALVLGPTPVAEAMIRCEQLLQDGRGGLETKLWVSRDVALLAAESGRFDHARELLAKSNIGFGELGLGRLVLLGGEAAGRVELLAGDYVRAATLFTELLEGLQKVGETIDTDYYCALLAEALYEQGRIEEAEEYADLGESLLGVSPHYVASLRSIRARLVAHRGRYEEAVRLAREGVESSQKTDAIAVQADSSMALGDVLVGAGRTDESVTATKHALGLYELKGSLVRAERARQRLDELLRAR